MTRALFEVWPELERRLPWIELGNLPTPVERVGNDIWVKRDDLSSPIYGGNKVRTLEVLFGAARASGATRVYSTGAFGSNHALATVLHANNAGLSPGVILFPQPPSEAALENLRATLSAQPRTRCLPHWSLLPLGIAMQRYADVREGQRSMIMVPGGATPAGALGYVSAALELARQVEAGEAARPDSVIVGVGSTCTSAGLLLGMRVAAELGIGWRRAPRLVSVRVTPWPVTSAFRIVRLARRASSKLAELTGEARWKQLGALGESLEVTGSYLGRGYGEVTSAGRQAIARWREMAGFELDTTYSAKAVACLLDRAGRGETLLYWSTKSTAPLPEVGEKEWRWAPPRMVRWLDRTLGGR